MWKLINIEVYRVITWKQKLTSGEEGTSKCRAIDMGTTYMIPKGSEIITVFDDSRSFTTIVRNSHIVSDKTKYIQVSMGGVCGE